MTIATIIKCGEVAEEVAGAEEVAESEEVGVAMRYTEPNTLVETPTPEGARVKPGPPLLVIIV